MLFVIILHILLCGGVIGATKIFSIHYEVACFIEIACFCAVDCYALISGYLGINRKYRYSSLAELWLQVLFYSIGIFAVCIFIPSIPVTWKDAARAFFPVMGNQYWYFTAYIGLYIMMPILNLALNTFSQRKLTVLLALAIVFFSVLPTVFLNRDVFGIGGGRSVFWLAILYCIGGYIKKYNPFSKMRSFYLFLLYLVGVVFTWLSRLILEMATTRLFGEPRMGEWFMSYSSPTILLAAVALFLAFLRLHITRVPRSVLLLSRVSFSVNLIHGHSLIYFQVLPGMFAFIANLQPWIMPFAVFGIAITIYLVCATIDVFRLKLFLCVQVKDKLVVFEEKCKNKYFTSHMTNSTKRS